MTTIGEATALPKGTTGRGIWTGGDTRSPKKVKTVAQRLGELSAFLANVEHFCEIHAGGENTDQLAKNVAFLRIALDKLNGGDE